jgi:hypothetical protein
MPYCLLIPDLPNNKGILTGKLFEYLGSGRPIWGFGPVDGDAQEILTQSHAGSLFEDSVEEACQTLEALDEPLPRMELLTEAKAAYTRMGLAEKLVGSRGIEG